jgi:hypothetical protein
MSSNLAVPASGTATVHCPDNRLLSREASECGYHLKKHDCEILAYESPLQHQLYRVHQNQDSSIPCEALRISPRTPYRFGRGTFPM